MIHFDDDRYVARRDVTFLRPRVSLSDSGGSVVCAARVGVARLRRRIIVSGDIDLTGPMFTITGQEMVGFSTRYDVTDVESQGTIGSVRRAGLLSTDRARWRLFDKDGQEVARVILTEAPSPVSSAIKGILPRTWEVVISGTDRVAARFRERWVASGITINVTFFPEDGDFLDRRLAIAGLMLLLFVR